MDRLLETSTVSLPSRLRGATRRTSRIALAQPIASVHPAAASLANAGAGGKAGALFLLLVVFVVNLGQTALEEWSPAATARGLEFASALHWLEGRTTLENHDVAGAILVYGYSIAYFVLFPLLAVVVAVALARQPDPRPFRTFAFALAADYSMSLPFFLFFPVPERWAYPDAGAILLSDLWDSRLIEAFRPMSALDNCFPSFHTSMTVVLVLCGALYRLPFRLTLVPLGVMVVLSTYSLGVHWIGDVVAGTAVGGASVALACRLTDHCPAAVERPRAR